MSTLLKVLGVLFGIAVIGLGVYLDISFLLVGGIEEVVHGAQTNPVTVHEIVEGVVRFLFSGAATVLAIVVGVVGGGAIISAA